MATRACLAVGCVVLLPVALLAASFSINPVRIDLAAERPYAVVQVTNTADLPVTLQARAYSWTGDEAHGGLTPTDGIILNPPLLNIAPKATRFIRLGLRNPNRGTVELTYRLILQEVPKTLDASDGAAVHTILRISVPVFAAPKSPVKGSLEWKLEETAPGKFTLTAANKGNAHLQVLELSITPAGKTLAPMALAAPVYVLPGQSRQWDVDAPDFAGQSALKAVAKTNAGTSEYIIETANPGMAKGSQ
jgi:fimbrial chaperone protein